jgi:predicted DNA-binding transcriptional regulator AlpA
MTTDHIDSYLTGPMVNERFNISSMTRWRWERNPQLAFPAPMKINNRSYWRLAALQIWENNRPSKSATASSMAAPIAEEAL